MNILLVSRLKRILILVCAALSVTAAVAEDYPRRINFQNIMQNQDIALGEVEAITQDHEGFMWLGGRNALLRYDGYEFLSIPIVNNLDDLGQKKNVNQVVELFEDSRHQLWVATRSGLYEYDRDHEVLVNVLGPDGKTSPVAIETADGLAEAPTGELLVGSAGGLSIFDTKTRTRKLIAHTGGDSNSLVDNLLYDVVVDKKNNLVWLASVAGLERLDWSTMQVTHFTPDEKNPKAVATNAIKTMTQDHNGDLWLGVDKGLYRFNPASGSFTHYLNDPNDPFSLSSDMVWNVLVDNKGWVWVACDKGLSLYDKDHDRFIRFFHEEGLAGSLSSSTTRRVYQDNSDDIWVGTYPSGVNVYDRSSDAIRVFKPSLDPSRGIMDKTVEAVVEDKSGNLWIGSAGITRYNPEDDTYKHYNKLPENAPGIKTSSPISGHLDRQGGIWFGSWANAYHHYNAELDRFDQMPFDPTLAGSGLTVSDKLPDGVVWAIFEDKNAMLWLGTHNSGLTKYDRKTGQYTVYAHADTVPDSIGNKLVWSIFEDSKNRFWVGTASSLDLMDREKGTFKHYAPKPDDPRQLANGSILAIFEDHAGRMWFGTDAGLELYHPETDDFTLYNTKDGFADNGIRSITEDKAGNLWLGTNNGVVMFNADTKIVRNYVRYNGEKIGGMATGASVATRKGLIVMGGKNGLYVFDTNKLTINKKIPPVALTDFRLFTKKVPIGGSDAILHRVVNQTDKVTLDYTKTMISFNFAALNYRDPDKNQFAYKLEGFDENWREVGNQRSALYTNLDAGTYIFRVKASNNDGIWNEEGKSITVVQLPPPWKTWWAYTIYLLIVIAIIIQFVQSQRKKRRLVEEQNRLLEIKVSERTAELSEKNNDIQAMLSNMRQGLFTLESGGNIHPEYSHFLQDIFETTSIAGERGLDLLFSQSNLGSDALNQVQEALYAMIGEDEMNFSFNSHLLVTEYEVTINGHHKFLSLDWNPIVVKDVVGKVMVSVRDVTLLKQMERDAQAKKRELDIISQLLNVSSKKFLSFVASCKRFVAENRAQIEKNDARSDAVIALLFRNMHTIKGNCRTFGFSYFSDIVHDVESLYSDLKADPEKAWNREQLLRDLIRVETILGEYLHIYSDVLGRGDSSSTRDQKGFWADGKALETIQQCLDAVHKKIPLPSDTKDWSHIQGLMNSALSTPLSEVLADVVGSLPSIAMQLEKEAPTVTFDEKGIRIRTEACELITNIFAHILRNCVDHGIEAPDVRAKAGKPSAGTIDIVADVKDDTLMIYVSDDGQGVNIDRLFKKGIEIGQWKETDQPSNQTIAELIFASGVSTKEQVTDISGRGVGMDAVKQFLSAQGGNIQLQLKEDPLRQLQSYTGVKIPFELIISLPTTAFLKG